MKPPSIDTRWLGRIDYDSALRLQEAALADVRAGATPGQFFLLEHEPVYTIGRTRDQSSLLATALLPHPVRETNRGGQATFHGPGQLVGYAILDLHDYGEDLHRYLRFLEQVVIDTIAAFGVAGARRDGLTGVWVEDRKIASIGVGVRHWVTMHGFGLNVRNDLAGFQSIIPCGISGVQMTSIERETGIPLSVETVAATAAEIFTRSAASLRTQNGTQP